LLRDDRAIEPLTVALNDPQPVVRRKAATALGNLASDRVAGPLSDKLSDPAPQVRQAAVRALGVSAGPVSHSALHGMLHDAHPGVRAAAAATMGRLGFQERFDDLIPLLTDSHPLVRQSAIWSLDDAAAVDDLIRSLDDPNKRVRKAATWTLGVVGASAAGPFLRAALAGLYGQQRATALEALSRIEGPEVLPLLTVALGDPHPEVRKVAVREARRAQSAAPRERLRAALSDPESVVRAEATRAAAVLGDRSAIPQLIDRFQRDPVPWIRARALSALVRLDARPARHTLTVTLDQSGSYLREIAAWGLARFGEPGPLAELRDEYSGLTGEARQSLTGTLSALGDPHARRLMRAGLTAPSRAVRRSWVATFSNGRISQVERDLLTLFGDGTGADIDPRSFIDQHRIQRMARALWRTPDEVRRSYLDLSAEIPLRIAV
jgi:HEAT repeat protein